MPILHPTYEAVLYYSGSIVTTVFRNIIYEQMFTRDLSENIQKKSNWTAGQFGQIAWEAYGAAFRRMTIFQQISVAKLSHGLWNTGAQKQLYGQDPDGLCPVCNQELETVNHIVQCNHHTATSLRQQLIEDISDELCLLGTPGAAVRSFIAGITWWLLHSENPCPTAPGFGSILSVEVWSTAAYAEQTSLGWGQAFFGRISKLWGDIFLKDNKSTSTKAHTGWTKGVIKCLWDASFRIWTHRNEALHGKTITEQAQIKETALHNNIQEAYEMHRANPTIIGASAQHLFDKSMETLLQKQRQYKLCWLRSVSVAIKHQQCETDKLRKQAARFFGTKCPPQETTSSPQRTSNPSTLSPKQDRRLPTEDISSPHSYNLRSNRRRACLSAEESDGYVIPPAMFDDTSESSYSWSGQLDVRLQCDSNITPTELQALADDDGYWTRLSQKYRK
mmetsp:Transcript_21347/g.30524  ORF Transcript_21347/g.30524 Transcript_21347/m.30524 type:complete len:447 (-) Transcript_21347:1241-2581(-)